MEKQIKKYGFLVTAKMDKRNFGDTRYGHVECRVMDITSEIGNPRWNWIDDEKLTVFFDGLVISAQVGSELSTDERRSYGWSMEYKNPYAVDMGTSEKMYKTLKNITAKMEKINLKYGRYNTFSGFVTRVMSILGFDETLFIETDGGTSRWMDNTYSHVYDIESVRYRIDEMEKRLVMEARGEEV